MDVVEEIRRSNLKALVIKHGSVRKLSDALGKSSSQVSQWINASVDSKTGKPRVVSSQSAREIEKIFNEPRGWFDNPIHPPDRFDVLLTGTPSAGAGGSQSEAPRTIAGLLQAMHPHLSTAPRDIREAIDALVLTYQIDPKEGERVAKAIKTLLKKDT